MNTIASLLRGCVYGVRGRPASFAAYTGVKQGGVLSSLLYNIYVDSVFMRLKTRGAGCYLGKRFVGATMYADDVVLLAPSAHGLQSMVNSFCDFASDIDLKLNASKSQYAVFGPAGEPVVPVLSIDGVLLNKSRTVNYLGVQLRAGSKLSCNIDDKLASFYRAGNAILCNAQPTGLHKAPKLLFSLFSCFCSPVLRYGLSVMLPCLSRRDVARLKVAHNSFVRRIFGFPRFEEVPWEYSFSRCVYRI